MSDSRELDARVAVEVMGIEVERGVTVVHDCGSVDDDVGIPVQAGGETEYDPCPAYSTDIRAAWEVVEKMAEGEGWQLSLNGPIGGWRAECTWWGCSIPLIGVRKNLHHKAEAATAPMAICLAALKAKGETT